MSPPEIYRHIVSNQRGKLVVEIEKAPELEVVQLLAEGLTPEEIGDHLGLCQTTIYRQLRAIRDALYATTNAHLVAIAIAHGMIDIEKLANDERA